MTDQKMMPIVTDALALREKTLRCKTSDAQIRASKQLSDLLGVMTAKAQRQYVAEVHQRVMQERRALLR